MYRGSETKGARRFCRSASSSEWLEGGFKPEHDKFLVKQPRATSSAPVPGDSRCSVIHWMADCMNDDLLICRIKQFC